MRLALLASALLGLVACNPYAPDLGDHPFRCGTTDPKCPEGYSCNADTNVCDRGGVAEVDAGLDGNPLVCNNDSAIEPNDTIANAFVTPIPDSRTCTSMVSLAICPDTDKDLFRFRVDTTGKNMKTTVTTNVAAGQLTLRVLNGSGNAIGSGLPVDASHIEVVINNLATGQYFVEVAAPATVENNYNLDILTCDVTGCTGVTCQ